MGDRCSCSLYFGSTPDAEILELLTSEFGEPDEVSEDGLWHHYEEINYGQLPDTVQALLISTKTPFAWWNGAGDSYAQGIELFDGENLSNWAMLEGDIMLSASAAVHPETLTKAVAAQAFWDQL